MHVMRDSLKIIGVMHNWYPLPPPSPFATLSIGETIIAKPNTYSIPLIFGMSNIHGEQ